LCPPPAGEATGKKDSRSATNVHRIEVWDLAANSQRWVFGEYQGKVTHPWFSPDGNVLVNGCDDGEIGLWSITGGNLFSGPCSGVS